MFEIGNMCSIYAIREFWNPAMGKHQLRSFYRNILLCTSFKTLFDTAHHAQITIW